MSHPRTANTGLRDGGCVDKRLLGAVLLRFAETPGGASDVWRLLQPRIIIIISISSPLLFPPPSASPHLRFKTSVGTRTRCLGVEPDLDPFPSDPPIPIPTPLLTSTPRSTVRKRHNGGSRAGAAAAAAGRGEGGAAGRRRDGAAGHQHAAQQRLQGERRALQAVQVGSVRARVEEVEGR